MVQGRVSAIGEVDYAAIKADRASLDHYVRLLEESSPDNRPELFPSRGHQLAYWLNAYNAFVTQAVAAHYPTRSVRDLGAVYSFFWRKNHTAGGVRMSLRRLENEIIRKRFADPRIHFAIVCASLSCPRLHTEAFSGDRLEEQLDRLARQFINERRNLTIDPAAGQVTLSKIFEWFQGDFGQPLLDYVLRYTNAENTRLLRELRARKAPRIRFHEYDWSINDPGSRVRSKNPLEKPVVY